jgi:hypothetical protein
VYGLQCWLADVAAAGRARSDGRDARPRWTHRRFAAQATYHMNGTAYRQGVIIILHASLSRAGRLSQSHPNHSPRHAGGCPCFTWCMREAECILSCLLCTLGTLYRIRWVWPQQSMARPSATADPTPCGTVAATTAWEHSPPHRHPDSSMPSAPLGLRPYTTYMSFHSHKNAVPRKTPCQLEVLHICCARPRLECQGLLHSRGWLTQVRLLANAALAAAPLKFRTRNTCHPSGSFTPGKTAKTKQWPVAYTLRVEHSEDPEHRCHGKTLDDCLHAAQVLERWSVAQMGQHA